MLYHVSLSKRLRYFDACVTPTILFALNALPLTKTRLKSLDVLQRKMLRRIVGWRRIPHEPWRETMQRMNQRLEKAQFLYFCQPWSTTFARAQWRYALHVVKSTSLWSHELRSFNCNGHVDVASDVVQTRTQGHPFTRWDDQLKDFCHRRWPVQNHLHWTQLIYPSEDLEQEFVSFLTMGI